MNTMQAAQELKPERVQEELAAEQEPQMLVMVDPVWISLKAERVQQPAAAASGGLEQAGRSFELTLSQKLPVTIELDPSRTIITLYETTSKTKNPAGALQAPDQTE